MRERRRVEIVRDLLAAQSHSISDCGLGALAIDPGTQAAEAP